MRAVNELLSRVFKEKDGPENLGKGSVCSVRDGDNLENAVVNDRKDIEIPAKSEQYVRCKIGGLHKNGGATRRRGEMPDDAIWTVYGADEGTLWHQKAR